MSYKVGYCPCCASQIMVQNSNGKWDSYKPNFRQADLIFENGQRIRTIVCEDCLGEDPKTFIDATTCRESEACDDWLKEKIKKMGIPVRLELALRAKQGIRITG